MPQYTGGDIVSLFYLLYPCLFFHDGAAVWAHLFAFYYELSATRTTRKKTRIRVRYNMICCRTNRELVWFPVWVRVVAKTVSCQSLWLMFTTLCSFIDKPACTLNRTARKPTVGHFLLWFTKLLTACVSWQRADHNCNHIPECWFGSSNALCSHPPLWKKPSLTPDTTCVFLIFMFTLAWISLLQYSVCFCVISL